MPSRALSPADRRDAALRDAHAWATAAFAPPGSEVALGDGIFIEQCRSLVLKNRTWQNAPLRLGDTTYEHALYMDTPATVRVSLDRRIARLTGEVGIDRGAHAGSARFHVLLDGRRVYSTRVLRTGDSPTAVNVSLNGAREFMLEVDDGDDGINHDQCVWGDAAVVLEDGTSLYLDELPLFGVPTDRRLGLPFSFRYDGRPSDEFLDRWDFATRTEDISDGTLRVDSYRDPTTGLLVECEIKTYSDTAAVDWVVYLENTGEADTPIIDEILPLDMLDLSGTPAPPGSPVLRWSNGDRYNDDSSPGPASFLPHDEPLAWKERREFRGFQTFRHLPFFNLQLAGGGWILAVGWTGHWLTDFLHDPHGRIGVQAGMQNAHFRLHPGERVRTPRIVLFRWHGEELADGNNAFRKCMLAHYVQKLDGEPAVPPIAHPGSATIYLRGMEFPTEEGELKIIDKLDDLGFEAYWMDAYWYPQPWMSGIGSWYPEPERFPRGLRPLADAAHERGLKFILWFILPAAGQDTMFAKEFPQYIHGGGEGRGGLWKMYDPEAREVLSQWLTDRIEEWDIDIYREDGSGFPPEDQDPDRQGLVEIKHLMGLYEFWGDVTKRNPGVLMDNCNGGGNRIDIETSSRGFYLWRSDLNDIGEGLKGEDYWPYMALADQVMVTGLSLYVPFHTGPTWDMRPYSFRSAMATGIAFYGDMEAPTFSDDIARQAIAELKELRHLYLGDIYPLLALTTDQKDWYAYQLDRPDLGEGCALFFRRPDSDILMCDITLRAIDPDAQYEVSLTGDTYELGPTRTMDGEELRRPEVIVREKPGSAVLRYRKVSE